ncbi:MAG: hypothetical protein JO316_25505 [Abitibacteriaceae bacterium]|nr:hypothetical protein [Abditibacteriaceae bacterium]
MGRPRKDVLLLALPVIALVIFGLAMSLNLRSSSLIVKKSSVQAIKSHPAGDTVVKVDVAYLQSFRLPGEGVNWKVSFKDTKLMDEYGQQYSWLKLPLSATPDLAVWDTGVVGQRSTRERMFNFVLPLAQVPRSVSKVTFVTRIIVDGYELPVAVVVRDNKLKT